jgi:hypothetical protein
MSDILILGPHLLGRRPMEPRPEDFNLRAFQPLDLYKPLPPRKIWKIAYLLNQGNAATCGGNAGMHFEICEPVTRAGMQRPSRFPKPRRSGV